MDNIWDVCSGFLSQAAKTSRKHYLIYLQNIFAEKVGETEAEDRGHDLSKFTRVGMSL